MKITIDIGVTIGDMAWLVDAIRFRDSLPTYGVKLERVKKEIQDDPKKLTKLIWNAHHIGHALGDVQHQELPQADASNE